MVISLAAVGLIVSAVALRYGEKQYSRLLRGSSMFGPKATGSVSFPRDRTKYNYSTSSKRTQIKTSPKPSNAPAALPAKIAGVSARAYLVGDIEKGEVYIGYNEDAPLPVASMSKLITAAAALYKLGTSTVIEITGESLDNPPDGSNLQLGEKFTVEEILYPLLLSSSNVAAEALASNINRTDFLELMSSYAWEIGMPNTYFADASGVNARNSASALDIFALAEYLVYYEPAILSITKHPSVEISTTTEHGHHDVESTHPFVRDSRFIGGKTGRTPEAGETMLTILTIGGKKLAFVVLGSSYGKRESDTRLLINEYSRKKF